MVDQGVAVDRLDVDEPDAFIGSESSRTVPVEADFLMAYSSPEGKAICPLQSALSNEVKKNEVCF